jgi:PAS domain S-box-containing protein
VQHLDFRGLVDAAADMIAVFDRERHYLYVNAALERATGVPAAALLGKRTDEVVAPEEVAVWREALEDVLRSGRPRRLEYTRLTPGGPRRFASMITRGPGDLACAVTRDITDLQANRLLDKNDEPERTFGKPSGHGRAGGATPCREARDRTRRLQALTTALSSAVEQRQVVSIMVDAGRAAMGAAAGFAWLLRDEVTLELAGCEPADTPGRIDSFKTISMTARLPVCDVIRRAQPMVFENLAAVAAEYPDALSLGSDPPFLAWVVIPFVVAGRSIGVASFSFHDERAFSNEERELLVAMMGQASLALDRCMLLEAERRARADAEAARQRERQLHVLAARLSSALTPPQVAAIVCEEVVSVLRAYSGAAAVHHGDGVRILGTGGPRDEESLARVAQLPLTAVIPIAEAIRTSELVWCASEAELAARYPHAEDIWRRLGIRSWGAVPFRFEGGTVGSLALSFTIDRELGPDDHEFLSGAGQLAAQALERARLYEALQLGEEQLRVALTAGGGAPRSRLSRDVRGA